MPNSHPITLGPGFPNTAATLQTDKDHFNVLYLIKMAILELERVGFRKECC